ncbi:hypothetical protein DFQ26_007397, partial [Actinomortierella ambigua]
RMPQQQPAHPLLALPKLSLERDREVMTANATTASPTIVTTPTTTTASSVVSATTTAAVAAAAAAAAVATGAVHSSSTTSCSGPGPTSSSAAMTSGTSSSPSSNALALSATQLPSFPQGAPISTHATSSLAYVRDYHPMETNQEQLPRPGHHHWTSTEHYSPSDSYELMDGPPLGRPPSLSRMRSSSTSLHHQHRRIRSSAAVHPSTSTPSSGSTGMLDVPVSARRRTQSAQYSPSMRLALADPALSKSLQNSPVSSRSSWEHVQQQNAKKRFESNVRRYYHQLVIGCERPQGECSNRLCRTSLMSPKLTTDAAAILSVQLAARPRLFFCEYCPTNPSVELPQSPLSGSLSSSPAPKGLHPSMRSSSSSSSSGALAKKKALHTRPPSTPATAAGTHHQSSPHGTLYGRPQHRHHGSSLNPPRRQPSDQVSRPALLTRSSPSLRRLAEQGADGQHHLYTDSAPPPPSSPSSTTSTSSSNSRKPFFDSILSLSPFSKIFAAPSDIGSSSTFSSSSSINRSNYSVNSGRQSELLGDQTLLSSGPSGSSHQHTSHDDRCTLKSEPSKRIEEEDEEEEKEEEEKEGEDVERNGLLIKRSRSSFSQKGLRATPRHQRDLTVRRSASSSSHRDQSYRGQVIRLSSSSSSSSSSCDEEDEIRLHRREMRRMWPRLYSENRVGLGVFPMSMVGNRSIRDDRETTPSPLHILSGGRHCSAKHDGGRRGSRGGRRSRRKRGQGSFVLGSSRDPDSDGSLSSVSRSFTDEDVSDVPQDIRMYKVASSMGHVSKLASSPLSPPPLSSSPPPAPSSSSLLPSSSPSSPLSTHEPLLPEPQLSQPLSVPPVPPILQEGASWIGDGMDSASSSDSEEAFCLSFMNLQLLRQAIATYNSSRLDENVTLNYAPSQSEPHLVPTVPPTNATPSTTVSTSTTTTTTAKGSEAIKNMTSAISTTYQYSQSTPSLCKSSSWNTISSEDEHHHSSHANTTTPSRTTKRATLSSSSLRYPSGTLGGGGGGGGGSSTGERMRDDDQGDSRFLLESIRAVFSNASGLGSSFLASSEASDSEVDLSNMVNVGGIDVGSLREAYEMLIELEPSSLFSLHGTNAMEILLARLELEMAEGGQLAWGEFEMRAIFILLMNPYLFEQPYQESLLNRTLAIFVALPNQEKLVEWISYLDEEGMAQLVTLFKMYLAAHFTPKPKGDHHPAVCAVKALDILYRANEMHIRRIRQVDHEALRHDHSSSSPSSSSPSALRDEYAFDGTTKLTAEGLSYKYFYSDVVERLQFKDEYRIWRESLDPSNMDHEFSYFAYPFLISPSCKAHIMNLDAMNQMSAFYEEACVRHAMLAQTQRLFSDALTSAAAAAATTTAEVQKGIRAITTPYLVLELTRARLVQEAFDQLVAKHADLKKPLKVAFVDVGEEGMDQGGVTKEFFQVMLEKVFDSKFGLFKELEETRAWWIEGALDGSSTVVVSEEEVGQRLVEYELVGILIGLALYNGVILGVRFPSILYRKLLGWPVDLQSFTESFPALGQGLRQMLEWSDGDVYDVFMRNFEISYDHMGQVVTLPLIPGGEEIEVTNDERQRYVQLYMDHYGGEHVSREFAAFQRGFLKICEGEALAMLRPEELELLLCGNPMLDMHDLEQACLYDDGYSAQHGLMREFWSIVHTEMTAEQHKQLLSFVTGSDRVPIRGLRDLVFVIQRNGPDSERLPTALTCFSRLLLPEYSGREKMKERLVTAIENSHGFGLV